MGNLLATQRRRRVGRVQEFQWPSVHTQPPDSCSQWPGIQLAVGAGRSIYRPGVHTNLASVQFQWPTIQSEFAAGAGGGIWASVAGGG